MAYNVIKGNVEFSGPSLGTIEDMVDDHSDQTIGGTKTFSQVITASSGLSASFFYGDGSNISNVVADGLNVTNPGNNRIITSTTTTDLNAETNLRFNGNTLSIMGDISASLNVSSSGFYGDGNNLTNIGPSSLNYGNGLRDLANNLELNLDTSSGLQVGVGGLKIHASTLGDLPSSEIHGDDLFIMYDDSASQNKKLSFSSLTTYLDSTTTFSAAGGNTQIQFNDNGDFGASPDLTFNSSTGLLTTVSGNFQTLEVEGQAGDKTILTLDKGENSASYVEFRNGGTKYAEIFGSSAENFKIRTTIPNSEFVIGHYTEDVITIDTNNTTFDTYKVTINQELVVTGSTTTASRIHATRVETGSYSVQPGDEIILMNNSAGATASLPPITSFMVGFTVTIKRTGAGAVQVSGSDGIDAQSTIDITPQGGFMRVVAADFGSSNYGWAIIAKSGSF